MSHTFGLGGFQRLVQARVPTSAERSKISRQRIQRAGEYPCPVNGSVRHHSSERFEPRVRFLDVFVISGQTQFTGAFALEQSP
jgi:hypothetical protein